MDEAAKTAQQIGNLFANADSLEDFENADRASADLVRTYGDRRAAEAASPAAGWQPLVETAPKDGTPIEVSDGVWTGTAQWDVLIKNFVTEGGCILIGVDRYRLLPARSEEARAG